MYEENENKIQWSEILKKVGMVALALLVIFGIFTLINRCTKKEKKKPEVKPSVVDMNPTLDILEDATLKYLTADNMPTDLNASKTIRLKILISKGLVENIKDSENNQCDTSESYSEVTRLENNYAVKLSLSCGQNKASRVIYVGCFSSCEKGLCKGEENQTGGICGEENNPTIPDDEKDKPTTPDDNTGVVKPNTPMQNNQTKPQTPSTQTPTRPVNPTTPSKITQYEFKKCTTKQTACPQGTLNKATGYCEYQTTTTDYSFVVDRQEQYMKTYTENATLSPSTPVVLSLTKAEFNNYKNMCDSSKTCTIRLKGLSTSGAKLEYYYTKYVYTCKNGGQPTNGICTYERAETRTVKGCQDTSYTYDAKTNKCTKTINTTKQYIPGDEQVCETTWSTSPTLEGWYRTGATK